ncbi:hypothetical protein KDRO_A02170 [Kluyveromyces lactis]|nr:hypothetical protein KDRO_A02170 [Kluyveromyces lactis]
MPIGHASLTIATKRAYSQLPSPPPELVKRVKYEDDVLFEIKPESTFYQVIYTEIRLGNERSEKFKEYYKTERCTMDNYKGEHILAVFFKPHYNFLQLVMHCLRDAPIFVIGITNGDERCLEHLQIPIITNGKNIINKMKMLDPLGGGMYPLDCCVLFDNLGYVQNTVSWQNSGHDARAFRKYLLDVVRDRDIIMYLDS